MRIYFIRHFETEWNKKDICQGWKNSNLTKKGKKDAGRIGKKLKNKKIEIIFSSDLGRCLETSKIINKFLNVKIVKNKKLRERNFGRLNGKNGKVLREELDIIDLKLRAPNGESINDMKKRVLDFIKSLSKKKYDCVLIVSHYGPMKIVEDEFRKKSNGGFLFVEV